MHIYCWSSSQPRETHSASPLWNNLFNGFNLYTDMKTLICSFRNRTIRETTILKTLIADVDLQSYRKVNDTHNLQNIFWNWRIITYTYWEFSIALLIKRTYFIYHDVKRPLRVFIQSNIKIYSSISQLLLQNKNIFSLQWYETEKSSFSKYSYLRSWTKVTNIKLVGGKNNFSKDH